MNPLTLVKRIQDINKKEAALGISDEASWHAKYKDSAYVYVGGIPFDLTEGDLLAVFAQYGELVDVNLIRDKGTGKSKGFAFLAYEDQRSTNLAVDNLNGAQILGRTIRVDHVNKYKKLEEEDEETKKQKREERGVCRAFQRGNCNRGDSCKFSHDEQRAANTGWGAEEDRPSTWVKDKYENSNEARGICRAFQRGNCNRGDSCKFSHDEQRAANTGWGAEEDNSSTWVKDKYENSAKDGREREHRSGNRDSRSSEPKRKEPDSAAYTNERSRPPRNEPNSREERDRRKDYSSRKYDSESYHREEKYGKERENRSYRDRDASQHRHRRERDD